MRFTIGEFSRITSLSIKSLRLYHDKGILIPAEVDEFTGYRYYDGANYEYARSIRILRRFDFSLAEIGEILSECEDETDMLVYLQDRLDKIRDQMRRYNEISRSLEAIIIQERKNAMRNDAEFAIEEKTIPTQLIAGHRMNGQYHEVGKGFTLIGKTMGRNINGKPLTLYYDGEYKEEDADFEACMPVRKGESSEDISVRELPGGNAVSLIHKGPYDTLHESYRKIMSYINEKGYRTSLPHREIYIKGPGMILKGNPQNYLTELLFMLEK